ncbi:MAG: hypothetical protein J6S19_08635 [Lentisphaeria bacterium]|nr:hypothetical protein [Lentisphaeria bacterium]
MPIRLVQRQPGQRKLARYRHTGSCIRVAGEAPGREREEQLVRCRIMAGILFLLMLAGFIAVFS